MATVTLYVPDEFKKKLDSMPEVKWSEVFRNIIIRKVEQLKKFEQMADKGEI
jgi:hypothetical protein|tara:strand:+ start:861 stop:1016 length:156 start_codon:yes stop_codon:yes gene_type:complete